MVSTRNLSVTTENSSVDLADADSIHPLFIRSKACTGQDIISVFDGRTLIGMAVELLPSRRWDVSLVVRTEHVQTVTEDAAITWINSVWTEAIEPAAA